MSTTIALLIEHDLIDYINAASTVFIAAFTAVTCFVVWRQLKASKDIERAWVTLTLSKDPMNSLMVGQGTLVHGSDVSETTTVLLQLMLKNEGNGPVWVKQFLAKMEFVDSLKALPRTPRFDTDKDDQHWYPPAFIETDSVRFDITRDGRLTAQNHLVICGKVIYLDKFREERFSTFGYFLDEGRKAPERLPGHPEYNRNT